VRRIIHPLKQLTEGARRIGAGNWGTEVKIPQNDEIGELAQTFNQMSRQLKESIESIQRSQEKMIQAEKLSALGQLSAGLAHELKNPLTSIKMILQAILDGSSSEMTKEDVEVILREIKKLDTILTQFLTFAKPPRLQLQSLDLSHTIEEVLSLMKTEMDRCGVKVTQEISSGLPRVECDHERIKQVLVNLFLNSIQAMPGGGRLWIEARKVFDNHREEVLLSIKDSGSGIQREHLEKVFDPFFTTKEGGTGLGLSIVYNIIKEHKGRIDIQSPVGGGTLITIILPRERRDE
jgi:signal transduction histidine kinase